jgi:hypothetical protein
LRNLLLPDNVSRCTSLDHISSYNSIRFANNCVAKVEPFISGMI